MTFKGKSKGSGIEFTNDYNRADILSLKKGVSNPAPKQNEPNKTEPKSDSPAAAPVSAEPSVQSEASSDKDKVYIVKLTGEFGSDISKIPVRRAIEEAKAKNAETLIFHIDNKWEFYNARTGEKSTSATLIGPGINQLLQFEDMSPVFSDEIQQSWKKQPRIVFWVKQALGGAAFLPFMSREIYMTSDGRMGGIGGLDLIMQGNRTVVEKQRSLRLAHAQGWAIKGGYDPRIVSAMMVVEYVLSYRPVGDGVEFIERMPETSDEVNLTDAGESDTTAESVRGRSKAFLTITPETGRAIRVVKDIADTEDELFFKMGIERRVEVVGRSDQIMKSWSSGLERATKDLRRLWGEEARTPIEGNYEQRRAARSKRIRAIEQIQDIFKRFGNALNDARQEIEIPADPELNTIKEQIRIAQQQDRR
ncbi:MAG: hypothetical protein KGS45_02755 [Planctomycetes bacterium]|nr:hypothetical protein [Planctomycetota bacterium]